VAKVLLGRLTRDTTRQLLLYPAAVLRAIHRRSDLRGEHIPTSAGCTTLLLPHLRHSLHVSTVCHKRLKAGVSGMDAFRLVLPMQRIPDTAGCQRGVPGHHAHQGACASFWYYTGIL
jgi:hypothetical protein